MVLDEILHVVCNIAEGEDHVCVVDIHNRFVEHLGRAFVESKFIPLLLEHISAFVVVFVGQEVGIYKDWVEVLEGCCCGVGDYNVEMVSGRVSWCAGKKEEDLLVEEIQDGGDIGFFV